MLLTSQQPKLRRTGILEKLRTVVLLGGSVRATSLSASIGRSVLNLPVDREVSLLGHWQRQVESLAGWIGLGPLPVRLLLDRAAPEPVIEEASSAARAAGNRAPVLVERDPFEFRGTGGILRDVLADYEDDDLILIGSASQLLLEPVVELVETMASRGGDVCLVSQEDGTPSGLMLLRCEAVRHVAPVGFVDMKEQALPAIAREMRVEVVKRPIATGLPVRSAGEYLYALRRFHRQLAGQGRYDDPYAEDWEPAFGLIEDGAMVERDGHIHDSVVLTGAKVGRGAVLVRCLVGPGSPVRAGEVRVDELLGASFNGNGHGNGGGKRR